MIDLLGLPGNELVWIFQRGWYRPRGGTGLLSFGWGQLLWGHGGRFKARDMQILKKTKEKRKGWPNPCGGKMNSRSNL